MPNIPQPIPYQGSKRAIADKILEFVPPQLDRIVEPFAGSAALSIAAAQCGLVRRFLLNDLNSPLMGLMDQIINHPTEISDRYTAIWHAQIGREKQYYQEVRDEFNRTHDPGLLLYLLARCVKAAASTSVDGHGVFARSSVLEDWLAAADSSATWSNSARSVRSPSRASIPRASAMASEASQ